MCAHSIYILYSCSSKDFQRTLRESSVRPVVTLSRATKLILSVEMKCYRVLGFCALCCCFPTKMLGLNSPILPLKCSVSSKRSHQNARIMLIIQSFFFLINFNIFNRKQTWPPRLLKLKTADLSSVSTLLYQGCICYFFLILNFSLHFVWEKWLLF